MARTRKGHFSGGEDLLRLLTWQAVSGRRLAAISVTVSVPCEGMATLRPGSTSSGGAFKSNMSVHEARPFLTWPERLGLGPEVEQPPGGPLAQRDGQDDLPRHHCIRTKRCAAGRPGPPGRAARAARTSAGGCRERAPFLYNCRSDGNGRGAFCGCKDFEI